MIAAVGLGSRPSRSRVERVVDVLQRAVPVPQCEIQMRRALGRQVLRQGLPLAAGREHVEDRIDDLAHIHLATPSATLGRRDQRLNQRPFSVAQIARITQPAPVSGTAMLGFPHLAPLTSDSGATQGITTDSPDSTTFWIGSERTDIRIRADIV